jgi:subtilase family protein
MTRYVRACRLAVGAALIAAAAMPLLAAGTARATVTSGPGYDHQADWPLDDLDAAWLWGVGQGASVKVAVVDTGVQAGGNRDLAGALAARVPVKPGESHGGVSSEAHGTQVAELIAGRGVQGDPNAVVGLAPRAQLIDIPVAGSVSAVDGDELAAGIEAAVRARARIINVSLGVASQGAALKQAVADAVAHGCLVVASAAPGTQPPRYPAASNGVLAVGGTGQGQQPDASLAGYAPAAVFAPDANASGAAGDDDAAAYVSAAAALIWSADPRLSLARLRTDLYTEVTGKTAALGGFGIVDPQAVLTSLGLHPPLVVPPVKHGQGFGWLDVTLIVAALILAAIVVVVWRKSSTGGPGPLGPTGTHAPARWQLYR